MSAPLRCSRRRFLHTIGAGATLAPLLPTAALGRPARSRRAEGVQIGAISYSFRAIPSSAEQVLGYLVGLGLTTVELMGNTAEAYAGAPSGPGWPRNFREMSDAERADYQQARERAEAEISAWRATASMEPFRALGEMYRDAGVEVDILKLGRPEWSDAEIDYAFRAAKAIGARGISLEISDEAGERMGPFATRHGLAVGMHNHTQVAEPGFTFDTPLSYSPMNALNLDIGHYVAGLGQSPIPILKRYHDRITHLHLKDRRGPERGQDNVAWGEGDTPIGEVLRLIRDEGWPITAMIELEYPIPETSSVLAEMARCVDYCRDALA